MAGDVSNAGGKRVVLVGHCRPDAFMLKTVIQRAAPDAVVEMVNDDAGVAAARADLLLVNRALDGEFKAETGADLLKHLAASGKPAPPMMLVSKFEQVQVQTEYERD